MLVKIEVAVGVEPGIVVLVVSLACVEPADEVLVGSCTDPVELAAGLVTVALSSLVPVGGSVPF